MSHCLKILLLWSSIPSGTSVDCFVHFGLKGQHRQDWMPSVVQIVTIAFKQYTQFVHIHKYWSDRGHKVRISWTLPLPFGTFFFLICHLPFQNLHVSVILRFRSALLIMAHFPIYPYTDLYQYIRCLTLCVPTSGASFSCSAGKETFTSSIQDNLIQMLYVSVIWGKCSLHLILVHVLYTYVTHSCIVLYKICWSSFVCGFGLGLARGVVIVKLLCPCT